MLWTAGRVVSHRSRGHCMQGTRNDCSFILKRQSRSFAWLSTQQRHTSYLRGGSPTLLTSTSSCFVSPLVMSHATTASVSGGIPHLITRIDTCDRSYISRAHPKPRPTYSVLESMDMILKEAKQRQRKRVRRWESKKQRLREKKQVAAAATPGTDVCKDEEKDASAEVSEDKSPAEEEDDSPYRNQDETIDLIVQLNLDPRKPNQTLRGSLSVPHGMGGKPVQVMVFTTNATDAQAALDAGATLAGGVDLVAQIQNGTVSVPISDVDRALATPEIMSQVSSIGKILGPRGLMPNAKQETIVATPEQLPMAVQSQRAGMIYYRADKNGHIHVPIGKASFGKEKLLDHLRLVMETLVEEKPEGAPKGKYLLKVYLAATQGRGVKVDLRTVDPASVFFMMDPESVLAVA